MIMYALIVAAVMNGEPAGHMPVIFKTMTECQKAKIELDASVVPKATLKERGVTHFKTQCVKVEADELK